MKASLLFIQIPELLSMLKGILSGVGLLGNCQAINSP